MNIKVPCIRKNKNTGDIECSFDKGLMAWIVLAPKGNDTITEANTADQATFKAFLTARFQDVNPATRWHKFGPIIDCQDTGSDAQTQELPDGSTVYTSDSTASYDLFFRKGGIQGQAQRRSFNGMHDYFTIYWFDKKWRLMGTIDPENEANTIGMDLDSLFSPAPKGATRSAIAEYKTAVSLTEVGQTVDTLSAYKCSFDIGKIPGVRDIKFKDVSSRYSLTAGQHAIEILADGGAINLVESIQAAIATATNFIFKKGDLNGADITKTTALSTDNKAVIISASLADGDYSDGDDMVLAWNTTQGNSNGAKNLETDANNPLIVVATNP